MQQNLADLLVSTISNTYGSYYGSVLSALATRSRATLPELIRAVPKSQSRDVRLALATLIQQHVVNHHTDRSGITHYEPNWEYAYNFTCRAPTMCKFIEERYDAKVAKVFNSVAQTGVASVAEMVAEITKVPTEKSAEPGLNKHDTPNSTKNLTDGEADSMQVDLASEDQEAVKKLYGALNMLLTDGYFMRIGNIRQFYPSYDREQDALDNAIAVHFHGGEVTTKKEKNDATIHKINLLKRWRSQDMGTSMDSVPESRDDRKRARVLDSPNFDSDEDDGRPAKRRRQPNGVQTTKVNSQSNGLVADYQAPVNHEWLLAVNYEKCAVGMRTIQMVRFCERHTHGTTAKVYDAVLRVLEVNIPRCFDPIDPPPAQDRDFSSTAIEKPSAEDIGLSDPVTTRQVAAALDSNLDLEESLPPDPDPDVVESIEDRPNGVKGHPATNGDHGVISDTRLALVEQHLNILFVDPRGFLHKDGSEWRVPFYTLTQRMIEYEIENTITHSLGILPARVIRILKFCGHLELLSISQKAMARQESVREACQRLQKDGWIDVVELPKTARREVMKSIWMWAFNVLKAREKVLADCYFTMSRLQFRLAAEQKANERIIDKSERSDVVGQEDKFLSVHEKAVLAKLSQQTNVIIRQMVRMDELVALMRDFSKMEFPHRLWDDGFVDARRLKVEQETPVGEEDWEIEEYVEEEEERAFDPDAHQGDESSDDEAGAGL